MTLDPEDVKAIAAEVVRLMNLVNGIRQNQRFEASIPLDEQKRRSRERLKQFKLEQQKAA